MSVRVIKLLNQAFKICSCQRWLRRNRFTNIMYISRELSSIRFNSTYVNRIDIIFPALIYDKTSLINRIYIFFKQIEKKDNWVVLDKLNNTFFSLLILIKWLLWFIFLSFELKPELLNEIYPAVIYVFIRLWLLHWN